MLKIAVTSKALFNLSEADTIYKKKGTKAYIEYMRSIEDTILKPGPAFPLINALTHIKDPKTNQPLGKGILISQNQAESSVSILRSISHYNLNIQQIALTGGASQVPYMMGFNPDLFLSLNKKDVSDALDNNIAAALLLSNYDLPILSETTPDSQLRLAFDGDAVLFGSDSEQYYKDNGLEKFLAKEKKEKNIPLTEGPLKKFLLKLHSIQQLFPEGKCPIQTALVTARGAGTLIRPIITLRKWGVRINVAVGLDGASKREAIKSFNPHLFFDDRIQNCVDAGEYVPSANLPVWANDSIEKTYIGAKDKPN